MKKPSSGYRRRLVTDVKDTSVEAGDNDRVGGAEQPADGGAEGQERGEGVPGVLEHLRGLRVLAAPRRGGERGQGVEGGLGRRRGVDRAQLPKISALDKIIVAFAGPLLITVTVKVMMSPTLGLGLLTVLPTDRSACCGLMEAESLLLAVSGSN